MRKPKNAFEISVQKELQNDLADAMPDVWAAIAEQAPLSRKSAQLLPEEFPPQERVKKSAAARKRFRRAAAIAAGIMVLCLFSFYGLTNLNLSRGKAVFGATDVDTLIKASPVILRGRTAFFHHMIFYNGVLFERTQIHVTQVYKGNVSDKTITLLQTRISDDPIVGRNSDVLLFLEKYDGPAVKDAYVCKGLGEGQYTLNGSKIIPRQTLNSSLNQDFQRIGGTIESLKAEIEKLK